MYPRSPLLPPPPRTFVVAVLLFWPLLLLHRPLLQGEAFLPADLLRYVAPWKSAAATAPPQAAWNVLRYDGITQFYPWRLHAARQVRSGRLPLWNPYQFGAEGGTPLLANSQSAPLYPLNVLYYLFPPRMIWFVFGLLAFLHLLIAASGTYRFLRGMPLERAPALLGATAFTLCAPVVTWLALPTFIAVSCWLPWLLLLIRRAHAEAGTPGGRGAVLGAGAIAGTLLLAGHLQVAFYCLLAAVLYALWHGGQARIASGRSIHLLPWLFCVGGAGLLAGAIAAAQVLPSVELSRVSHRAGAPSWPGYQAYSANALPPRSFVTLLAPDFFGHPNSGNYWNTGNYAEFAVYVGVLPLLLAAYCLALPWRGAAARESAPSERGFFAGLGLLALLMALGTPINLPFFFGVPGFGQTGSPARSLLLAAFSLSVLAALGLQALIAGKTAPRMRLLFAIAAPVLVASFGASQAARFAAEAIRIPFGELMTQAGPGLIKTLALLVLSAVTIVLLPRLTPTRASLAALFCVALTGVDLLSQGIGYNPSAPPAAVYPVTPGIRWLQENAPRALIAPLNRTWSLTARPPDSAVLPPNALTVYGLHDLAGYDSLFPGAYKRRVAEVAGGEDPSPPENGNIIFIKSIGAAKALGARYLITPPEAPDISAGDDTLRLVYTGSDMTIYAYAGGRDWQPPPQAYRAASFRLGLFLTLSGIAAAVAAAVGGGVAAGRKRHSRKEIRARERTSR